MSRRLFISMSVLLALVSIACDEKKAAEPRVSVDTTTSEQLRALEGPQGTHPETSQRLISPSELRGMSEFQLRVMKSEIYARHGMIFTTPQMKEYFEKQPWYRENPKFKESMLTQIERENVATIDKVLTHSDDAGSSKDRKAIVTTWGKRLAESDGEELYRTEYELFDVDDDADRDVVALYFVGDGGSYYEVTMAVFENLDGVLTIKAHAPAGSSGDWSPKKIVNAQENTIVLETEVWLGDDPNCCPSGKGTVVYQLAGSDLRQKGA